VLAMVDLYRFNDKELQLLLKSITIVIDTRETSFAHITKWFDDKKIPYITQKIESADYSFYIPAAPELGIARDLYFTDKISIERKGDLVELSGNFTGDRLRIESEFIRHKGKMILLIEDADYADIIKHNYRTEYKPESFLATLHSFSERYDIPFTFMKDKKCSGQFVYYTFYYWLRNFLLHK
jgi:ERCC4-type nuclease